MITVIGGGTGGYTAAIRAAQLGADVTLVEKEEIGGTCLNWGCIPSKVFLQGSSLFSQLKLADSYGVSAKSSPFDMRQLVGRKNEIKQSLVVGLKNVVRSYGIQMVHGEGRILDEKTVAVGEEKIPSEKIVIATGIAPDVPHLYEEMVLTYKEAFQLDYLPRSVLIVYGGVYSVELASFFLELGCQVTMLTGGMLLEKEFEDIEGRVDSYLKSRGARAMQGRVASIKKGGEQKVVVVDNEEIVTEEVIWMKKRTALTGIPPDLVKGEYIQVDDHMQTNIPSIYAVGDITGSFTAGDAIAQGMVAAEHALGKGAVYRGRLVPKVIYTPEAAVVGMTEAEAARQYDVVKGSFPFGASGRAQTLGTLQGKITLLSDRKYGEILGAHIIGRGASELIHLVSFAMSVEATLDELSSVMCAHPTMMEIIKDASLDTYGNALNLPRK